ncbi:GNAT superfamily N-acetyltransferase [Deinococcus sp. HSC-46F16]|uniref:GNAT family N-acetyltransferase n=1 Tax=Deinococcus sp. HSC-46F16 TaxID=2910968 RepID=UPI0020A204AC|nr:GNAT family N-acetyltransferase [Deinococcus sp. HSC-46F16]MCP2015194.1 GNAT superfamily N-acetyltransferase [Deinococcus sp. HSC-46F16]
MTPPLSYRLRTATTTDAPALARVHVTSWRETYAGLLPDDFLPRMTDEAMRERREANWQRTIAEGQELVLVGEREGEVLAFASAGPPRDHPGVDAELYTLYALKGVQGLGLGRALLVEVARQLCEQGHRSLALWVLDVNPTRAWYARQGGREDGVKRVPLPGGELREVRLVWDDLAGLR